MFLVIGQDRRRPLAADGLAHAIELDEIDRRLGPRAIRHAVAEAGADEGEVRVAVLRLDLLLGVAQFGAQLHPIVPVAAALRKEGVEGPEEQRQQVLAVAHARRQALIEIPRRRVERAIQRAAMPAEEISRFFGEAGIDVDRFETALGARVSLSSVGCVPISL